MRIWPSIATSMVIVSITIAGFGVDAASAQTSAPRGASANSAATQRLPADVDPDSRNRLPLVHRDQLNDRAAKAYDAGASASKSGVPQGAAEIRLAGTGSDVRWASPMGRRITELAIITTAREMDQPYEYSLHVMEATAVGVDPAVISVVNDRKSTTGLDEKQAAVIHIGREINGKHKLSAATYANGLKIFGQANLVDLINLMGSYASTAVRLTAFNQQMPPQMKQFLTLPFTLPDDIHSDSRSRLPLVKSQGANAGPTASLYSRLLEPEGTGPQALGRHGSGGKSLEASVGRPIMDLAGLLEAREYGEQYDWTVTEIAARQDGLEPAAVDAVRDHKPTTGLSEKEATLIDFGRELTGKHVVKADTYAHALNVFGERDLADLVSVIAQHAGEDVVLIGFDQHLPEGQEPLLPAH